MARPKARTVRSALSFLDLRSVPDAPVGFEDAWAADKRPADLIRAHLETQSNYGFIADIRSALEDALAEWGSAKELAAALLPQLLTAPSFSSAKANDDGTLVRQAVLFERPSEEELEVLVTVDVQLRRWQRMPETGERVPASATCVAVTCDQFDMAADKDLGRAMAAHVQLLRDFPEPRQNPRSAAATVMLLGDLRTVGASGTPATWRNDIELLAEAFGVKPSFRQEPTFTGTVSDSTVHVIRFEPYEGIDPRAHDGKPIPFTPIQARTATYDQVFHKIAATFADLKEESEPDPYAARALKPGEKIFHRKVGNGRKFDRFDKGSTLPCMHDSFVTWNKSPKALKGFHRRYTNFEDAWLRHCSRGMNCGMYAAFTPDKL